MKFQYGDRVRVTEPEEVASPASLWLNGKARDIWLVMDEDTGNTPVSDPEPAYRLTPAFGPNAGTHVRYAYQSVMHPA